MPIVLSPVLNKNIKGVWGEGDPYNKQVIYDMSEDGPPVNYSSYEFKPHSLPHIESAAHTQKDARTLDSYFQNKEYSLFYGNVLVLKFEANHMKPCQHNPKVQIKEITLSELQEKIKEVSGELQIPDKIIIGFKGKARSYDNVLLLSHEAASWLVDSDNFNLYGTSWKSSDYMPGSRQRPIHNKIFEKALIMECLDISEAQEGEYFLNAFPIPCEGASESVVCPVLFEKPRSTKKLKHDLMGGLASLEMAIKIIGDTNEISKLSLDKIKELKEKIKDL